MLKKISIDDNNEKYDKVKDHCLYTRKFRGADYNVCNLRYKTPNSSPIVFHNGYTYDYNSIIKQLAK